MFPHLPYVRAPSAQSEPHLTVHVSPQASIEFMYLVVQTTLYVCVVYFSADFYRGPGAPCCRRRALLLAGRRAGADPRMCLPQSSSSGSWCAVVQQPPAAAS